jgi:hypothetical protein
MNSMHSSVSSDEETLRSRIHVKLKEIMLQVDLDEVTSKFVNIHANENDKNYVERLF